MEEFRKGASRVLITTDVWARGLDVQQVGPAGGWKGSRVKVACFWCGGGGQANNHRASATTVVGKTIPHIGLLSTYR